MDVDDRRSLASGEERGVGAREEERPEEVVSTFRRMSSSEWVRIPAVGTEAPALLISTVTSGAASTAARIDAASVTSRASGTTRSSSQVRGVRALA